MLLTVRILWALRSHAKIAGGLRRAFLILTQPLWETGQFRPSPANGVGSKSTKGMSNQCPLALWAGRSRHTDCMPTPHAVSCTGMVTVLLVLLEVLEVAATVVLAVLVQGDHHRNHRCNRAVRVMGSWRCWRSQQ